MIVRGRRVYRGSRSASTRLPAALLSLAVLALLLGLLAFSLLPQYLVYHRDSVDMVVPFLEESGEGYTIEGVAGPVPYAGTVNASVDVTEPDYSSVSMVNLSGMNYLRGYYVPLSRVTETGLDNAVKEAQRSDIKGLVLQMKDESGKLAWMSGVALAASNAANSDWDPAATLAELKADGWALTAELSCCVDTLLATQNPGLALKDAAGAVYADGRGSWVDPWNRSVRSYVVELCQDLLRMGFEEIILTHVEHPKMDVGYTREIASRLDRSACVMSFAISVRGDLEKSLADSRGRLCAVLDHDVLTPAGADNGQDLDNFLRVFERIVIPTATYSEDVTAFLDRKIDSTLRFVPQMTWAFGGGSLILDPAAPTAEE